MFNWAWRREYIWDNPALRADNPSVPLKPPVAPERDVVASHFEILLETNLDLSHMVWLAATLGLRRSEIVALRWSDIDFQGGKVHVRHGVTKTPGYAFIMNDTKTGLHGQASFPLHPCTRLMLEERSKLFRNQLISIGVDPNQDGYVFSFEPEHQVPVHPDQVTKALRLHCGLHPELQAITLQGLRKYAASDLAEDGVDETSASALLRNRPETARLHYQAANSKRLRKQSLGIADRLAEAVGMK
jgi:integrase